MQVIADFQVRQISFRCDFCRARFSNVEFRTLRFPPKGALYDHR